MKSADLLARTRVVLCRPSHPGNIGGAARAMKNMGLSRLVLVAPRIFPDAEATARAAGADDILANAAICQKLDEALAGTTLAVALSARSRDLGPQTRTIRESVGDLLGAAAAGEVALVFGNETSGLSNAELQRCHAAVTIPANPEFSSLNLAAAVQVLCYELRMAVANGATCGGEEATPFSSPLATHDEIEGFYTHLEAVMAATGFLNPGKPGRLLPKLRRLFGRVRLEKDEVNILRGILAATQNKTGHGR